MKKLLLISMLVWKVWYDDGSGLRIYHSQIHPWAAIPDRPGVQIVLVCQQPPYRNLLHASDWYWPNGDTIKQTRDGYPTGTWSPRPSPDARAGLTITNETFERYRLEALKDKTCSLP